jgi:hypothetical protein
MAGVWKSCLDLPYSLSAARAETTQTRSDRRFFAADELTVQQPKNF